MEQILNELSCQLQRHQILIPPGPSYFIFAKCLHIQKCEFQLQALLLVTNAKKKNHIQRNFCTTTDFISVLTDLQIVGLKWKNCAVKYFCMGGCQITSKAAQSI